MGTAHGYIIYMGSNSKYCGGVKNTYTRYVGDDQDFAAVSCVLVQVTH
jgi:hypothetical protein